MNPGFSVRRGAIAKFCQNFQTSLTTHEMERKLVRGGGTYSPKSANTLRNIKKQIVKLDLDLDIVLERVAYPIQFQTSE